MVVKLLLSLKLFIVCFPSFQILLRDARERKMKIIRIKAGFGKSADAVYTKKL